MEKKYLSFIKENYLFIVLFIISNYIHNITLSLYPAYHPDETMYVSRAWDIINYFTTKEYDYQFMTDHPPFLRVIICYSSL